MKPLKLTWIILTMGMLIGYSHQGNAQRLTGKRAAEFAVAKVKALPEVRQFLKTAKRSEPMVMLDSEPSADLEYYWIKVSISNFDQFRTNFNFFIDPKTFRISYLDTYAADAGTKLITLQQW